MKTVNFSATCIATYNSSLKVPDEIHDDQMVDYIKKHLSEAPVEDLEYVGDTDKPLTEEDIISIENNDDEEDDLR